MIRVRASRGFTLVELLIVIVVIAILAAITIVAYGGVTAKARDATRKQDLANISNLLQVAAVNGNSSLQYGSSCAGGTAGWFSQTGTALSGTNYGSESASQCLAAEANTTTTFTDPSGATSCATGTASTCFAYMFASCSGVIYIFAHLETVAASSTATDGTCEAAYDSTWGMNYYVQASVG